MSMEVILDGHRVVVPSGAMNHVAIQMHEGKMTVDQARDYLRRNTLDGEKMRQDLGRFNFDQLDPSTGMPTIQGTFYANNTRAGLIFSGRVKELIPSNRTGGDGIPGGPQDWYGPYGPRAQPQFLNQRRDPNNWYGPGGIREQPIR